MSSNPSTNLRLELMTDGEDSGTWGDKTNVNLGTLLEQAIGGVGAISMGSDADITLSATNYASDQSRNAILSMTSGVTLTATRNVLLPSGCQHIYIAYNNTTGAQSLTFKVSGGTGVTVPNGARYVIYTDGTNTFNVSLLSLANNWTGVNTFGAAIQETETAPTISAGALTLNLNLGTVFAVSFNANITSITVSNPAASGSVSYFVLRLNSTGTFTIVWPGSFGFMNVNGAPTAPASGKTLTVIGYTYNGGTNYDCTYFQNY